MSIPLRKPGTNTLDPRMDLIPEVDPRNANYPLGSHLEGVLTKRKLSTPRSYTWQVETVIDQGSDGACVGCAVTHDIISEAGGWAELTTRYDVLNEIARPFYYEAQKIDPWAGGEYPGAVPRMVGTSLLAGAKTMRALGWWETYRWAETVHEIVQAVAYLGPVIIGSTWTEGMANPVDNVMRATGETLGGHAVAVIGVKPKDEQFEIVNSWGSEWGNNGRAVLPFETVQDLFDAGRLEAVAAESRAQPST